MAVNSQHRLNARAVRSVYLITYSRADLVKVPSREYFARIVREGFDSVTGNDNSNNRSFVEQWVCCQEPHREQGIHYHMAVKLCTRHRWLQVRDYLSRVYHINVNFSSNPANYYEAWQYTTKEDRSYIESDNHPDLTNAELPQTTQASSSRLRRGRNRSVRGTRQPKKKALSVYDVGQLCVKKGIHSRLELLALAENQRKQGKKDLAEFALNKGFKAVDDALTNGWELKNAPTELKRKQLTRYELLEDAYTQECVPNCDGKWLRMALDILKNNNIQEAHFSQSVRTLLMEGRGKGRNLLLHGRSNCGKTFLLQPLNILYSTFTNPATTSFAWVGAESSEVIFLNDFRWSPQIIPWHNFLLLLEGQKVHLAAPKTHFAQDIPLEHDVPIFCTTKEPFTYVKSGILDRVCCTDKRYIHIMYFYFN